MNIHKGWLKGWQHFGMEILVLSDESIWWLVLVPDGFGKKYWTFTLNHTLEGNTQLVFINIILSNTIPYCNVIFLPYHSATYGKDASRQCSRPCPLWIFINMWVLGQHSGIKTILREKVHSGTIEMQPVCLGVLQSNLFEKGDGFAVWYIWYTHRHQPIRI